MYNSVIFSIMLCCGGLCVGAQEQSVEVGLFANEILSQVRVQAKDVPALETIARTYGPSLIDQQDLFFGDSNKNVRKFAYDLFFTLERLTEDTTDRRRILHLLLENGFRDRRPGARFMVAARIVHRFKEADFSEESSSLLFSRFLEFFENNSLDDDLILVVGIANVKQIMPALKEVAEAGGDLSTVFSDYKTINTRLGSYIRWSKPTKKQGLAFSSLQARARMGSKDDTQKCIAIIDACDDNSHKMTLFRIHLMYIREPEIIDYLKTTFLYNDTLLSGGDGGDVIPTTYAEKAVSYLRMMIKDFPTSREMIDSFITMRNDLSSEECRKLNYYEYKMNYYRQWMERRMKYDIIR